MALLNVATVARKLKVSESRVYALMNAGKLPYVKLSPGKTSPKYIEDSSLALVKKKANGTRGADGRKTRYSRKNKSK